MESTLDILSQYAVIVQTITTCVIAWATYVYMKVTRRMFEANIDPLVSVDIFGNFDSNSLTIQNDAGCSLINLEVFVSVGYSREDKDYPIRRCIYHHIWPELQTGAVVTTQNSPIDNKNLIEIDEDLPEGVKIDPNDLLIEYSFLRKADQRRYCFSYHIGFLKDSKGNKTFLRIGEPDVVPTLKKVIVRRIDEKGDSKDPVKINGEYFLDQETNK